MPCVDDVSEMGGPQRRLAVAWLNVGPGEMVLTGFLILQVLGLSKDWLVSFQSGLILWYLLSP